jgi:putative endonuclease
LNDRGALPARASGADANARRTGALWEHAALAHLAARGLTLVERNFTCRFGEIDLIVRDGSTLVFVEVRYRGDEKRGGGTLSVGAGKRARLVRAALLFLQAHPRWSDQPCRFDVVGCSGTSDAPVFDWIPAAFEAF